MGTSLYFSAQVKFLEALLISKDVMVYAKIFVADV